MGRALVHRCGRLQSQSLRLMLFLFTLLFEFSGDGKYCHDIPSTQLFIIWRNQFCYVEFNSTPACAKAHVESSDLQCFRLSSVIGISSCEWHVVLLANLSTQFGFSYNNQDNQKLEIKHYNFLFWFVVEHM